jgi:transposase-like protein
MMLNNLRGLDKVSKKYWLILEKSDETRISQGIDGYQDLTGESYSYDSLVPNHKNVAVGDSVIIRKENDILGTGEISEISEVGDTKIHRRCPECKSTDVRERKKKLPRWKCGSCADEFSEPLETIREVRSYVATINGFQRVNSPPPVMEVKRCAETGNGVSSQHSIMRLNEAKIRTLFEGLMPVPSVRNPAPGSKGQGFGLSQPERKAVEMRAMHVARSLYEDEGWKVIDKSASHPFDLLATKGKQERFIEVKGTTGLGRSVILTHGEVDHARAHARDSALVIVSGIILAGTNGEYAASGGEISTHADPWTVIDTNLKATQYRYEID